MPKYRSILNILIIFIFNTLLISCGGGGGSEEAKTQDVNHAPNISISGIQNINEGQTIELTAQASDPDGDVITEYIWSLSPNYDIEFTQNNNVISFIAPDVTEDVELNVNITVKDSLGASSQTSHTLTITHTVPSYMLTSVGAENGDISPANVPVKEGEAYTFTISPDDSYEIDLISGCEGELNGHLYTTEAISEACDIQVSFRLIPLSIQANIQDTRLAECLDATNNTTIEEVVRLDCSSVTNIQELSVFVNLDRLVLNSAQLNGETVFPYLPSLTYLYMSRTGITTLDVSSLTELEELHLPMNKLSELDVSALQKLTTIFVYNNELSSFDISQNLALTVVDVSGNNLSTFNSNENIELIQLDLDSTNLKAIDLSNNMNLKYFSIMNNELTDIDLSNNPNLEKIWLKYNKLVSLDLSENIHLNLVWAGNNKIENVSGIESIIYKDIYFTIYNNPLSSGAISYLENLRDNLGYSKLRIVE
jgi:hypothetical protein